MPCSQSTSDGKNQKALFETSFHGSLIRKTLVVSYTIASLRTSASLQYRHSVTRASVLGQPPLSIPTELLTISSRWHIKVFRSVQTYTTPDYGRTSSGYPPHGMRRAWEGRYLQKSAHPQRSSSRVHNFGGTRHAISLQSMALLV